MKMKILKNYNTMLKKIKKRKTLALKKKIQYNFIYDKRRN